jgi:hypothetical protein
MASSLRRPDSGRGRRCAEHVAVRSEFGVRGMDGVEGAGGESGLQGNLWRDDDRDYAVLER